MRDDTRPIAFFDFDGTLTKRDTLMPFLKYIVGAPKYYAKLVLLSPVLATYFARMLPNDITKQFVLRQYLAGYHIEELFEIGNQFSEQILPTMLRPEGMERLRWHQEQGHNCVLVSASMDIYLKAWANREFLSDLFCTVLEVDADGRVSGKLKGKNCFGEEKLKWVLKYCDIRDPIKTFAYGDSSGDIPMLTYVDKGFIFNNGRFEIVDAN